MKDFNTVKAELVKNLKLTFQADDGRIYWYAGTLESLSEFMKWVPCTSGSSIYHTFLAWLQTDAKTAEEVDAPPSKPVCPKCGGELSEDRGGYVHCYACHFEFSLNNL